jgi:hypothetical protein
MAGIDGVFVGNPSEKPPFCPGCPTDRNRRPGDPVAGFAGQFLVHPSHLCQIGESDQGRIALQSSPAPNQFGLSALGFARIIAAAATPCRE